MFGHVTQIFGVKAASGRRSDTIPELISNRSRERFLEDDESQRGAHSIFVFFTAAWKADSRSARFRSLITRLPERRVHRRRNGQL